MRPTLGHTLPGLDAPDFWRCAQWYAHFTYVLGRQMDRSSSLGPTRIVYIYGLSGIIHGPCSMRIRRRPLFWTRVGTPYRPIPLPIQHGAMRYVAEICLFASWMRSLDR